MILQSKVIQKIHLKSLWIYHTYQLGKKAFKNSIKYMPGELIGKKLVADKLNHYKNFNLDSDQENMLSCAIDGESDYQENDQDKNSFYALFPKENCVGCEMQSQCRIKSRKKHNSVSFNEKRDEIGKLRETMGKIEYIQKCNQRAGSEGISSVFKHKFNVDDIPVRGEVSQKILFLRIFI